MMKIWREYWSKRKMRKSDEYQRYYQEFWMEHIAGDWLPDLWRSYRRYARFAYPVMLAMSVVLVAVGVNVKDMRAAWHGLVIAVCVVILYAEFRWIYWTSELRAADEYALAKCGGADEAGLEKADAE